MVAHHTGGVVVVGSNPAAPTKHKKGHPTGGLFYAQPKRPNLFLDG